MDSSIHVQNSAATFTESYLSRFFHSLLLGVAHVFFVETLEFCVKFPVHVHTWVLRTPEPEAVLPEVFIEKV